LDETPKYRIDWHIVCQYGHRYVCRHTSGSGTSSIEFKPWMLEAEAMTMERSFARADLKNAREIY
jgi:hypothetical protein